MNIKVLMTFIVLLIVGFMLNSQENIPESISNAGGLMALLGGIGLSIYILSEIGILRR